MCIRDRIYSQIHDIIFSPMAKSLHALIKTNNNPQFLYSLWRSANARNASFPNLSLWNFDFLSTRLIKPSFHVSLCHRPSTTVSLETRNLLIIWWATIWLYPRMLIAFGSQAGITPPVYALARGLGSQPADPMKPDWTGFSRLMQNLLNRWRIVEFALS